MPEVVTLGETMAVFDGITTGPLRYISTYERHSGGAETNVAVGVVRLGHSAGWISRLGDDEFGKFILNFFRGEGVDVSQVKMDPYNPTGIFFRQQNEVGESKNFYYRKGSAASFLSVEDLDEAYIKQAKYLHVTGITPALSPSCCETVEKAMEIARKNGVRVSFDPNLRLKLWSKDEAKKTLLRLMVLADIVLPGIDECQILFDTTNDEEIFKIISSFGADTVVIKLGPEGAVGFKGGEKVVAPGFPVKRVVDPFGAGDAFAAGFLAGQLKNWSFKESLTLANAVGALAVTVKGNVEAMPTLEEAQRFIQGKQDVNR